MKLFKQITENLGQLDIVFSNAGIEHWGNLDEIDEAQIDKVCLKIELVLHQL